jgi:putative tricarboxylic transport membrane protein
MKKTREQAAKSLFGPLLIFLLAVYLYFLARQIDAPPGPDHLGAAFWPKMILILLMVSCGIKAVEILRAGGSRDAGATQPAPPSQADTPRLAAMIAVTIAAVFFMELIGFPLANFFFLLCFMRIAGLRRKGPLILWTSLGTVFLLYLFVKVVYLPLPKGQWFFDDVTIFLYRVLHII